MSTVTKIRAPNAQQPARSEVRRRNAAKTEQSSGLSREEIRQIVLEMIG